MAGNQTDARRKAQDRYLDAKKTGASQKVLDELFAEYAAAQEIENRAAGTSHTARR